MQRKPREAREEEEEDTEGEEDLDTNLVHVRICLCDKVNSYT